MTEQGRSKKAERQIQILELKRETVQDLTEAEAAGAEGGFFGINTPVIGVMQRTQATVCWLAGRCLVGPKADPGDDDDK